MANFTNYFNPSGIKCPQDYVKDVKVLYDGTANNGEDYSIALLKWKDEWTLGIRWNRSMREELDPAKISGTKMCIGIPISFSHPVWFVIPWDLQKIILNNLPVKWQIDSDNRKIINQIIKRITL